MIDGGYSEVVCINAEDGCLVFEPRDGLTETERERADLHLGDCPACQLDLDCDYLMSRIENE